MYDPFVRGLHPVGVKSDEICDPVRDGRKLPLELWYPAHARHQGQDLSPDTQDRYTLFGGHTVRQDAVRDAAPATGSFPLVVFSHGFAGHRRQSTFFCTHLASHGYVVIAMDHAGNTLPDMIALAVSVGSGPLPSTFLDTLSRFVADRPRDVAALLDAIERGAVRGLPLDVTTSRVGMAGHSFGGWTTLVASRHDTRIVAALPLAPAGGPGPLATSAMSQALELGRLTGRVDTLYLALERDSLLPLSGIRWLFERTPAPARLLVLERSDHMHFCDRVERSHEFFRNMPPIGPFADIARQLPPMSALVPGEHGHVFANGMGTAHFDAVLKRDERARALRDHDAVAALGQRGVQVSEVLRPA